MTTTVQTRPEVGALLRTWRERRRLSQLELSTRAQVSTRHLSYVETGRSRPTAEMIDRIADSLEVPLRSRDELLLAGGYAPRHGGRGLDHADLGVVLDGLRHLLDAHLPNPALLLDRHWDVVDANAATDLLLAGCEPALLEPPVNAIRVSLHPGGLAPRIRNLSQWAAHLVHQVQARADLTHDPALVALARGAAAYVPGAARGPRPTGPVLALELEHEDGLLRFFSVSARLETATDATLDELHLETFLPADRETQRAMASVPR
ncbi:Helix-turn-helix domain-containing protein [Pedococcus cremeus]|uniref:Helix-turn-helix domain-containing protein n=1 Tax=Pedococcus cremeus TaxID=587636 RepID=A0A1H9VIS3_9MICO|nr:helix-turn-helix transcriptional regulator [Pedococcus cremeus]SES21167.1 Helix-turn-helix domain-containing protein [Pedococcus cremeus]